MGLFHRARGLLEELLKTDEFVKAILHDLKQEMICFFDCVSMPESV